MSERPNSTSGPQNKNPLLFANWKNGEDIKYLKTIAADKVIYSTTRFLHSCWEQNIYEYRMNVIECQKQIINILKNIFMFSWAQPSILDFLRARGKGSLGEYSL